MTSQTPLNHPDALPFYFPGRKPACLLLHGLTSTPWEIRPVGLALREAGIHAESMWLPGHGTTPHELSQSTWREWVAAAGARLDGMIAAHGEVAVMGSSLGASIALWLAGTHPVQAIVTMGGAVGLRPSARLLRWLAYLRPFQKKRASGSSIRDPQARALHPSYPVMSLRAVAEMLTLLDNVKTRLHLITAPALIMHSRHDSVIAPANATLIYEGIRSPKKQLLWLENSDHIITEDYDAPIVKRAAVEWIQNL